MLLGIHIQNFGVLHDTVFGLSFEELAGQSLNRVEDLYDPARTGMPADRLPASQINVLIGRNSTGKSAFFTALSFISDCMRHGVPFAADQEDRGGLVKLRTDGECEDVRFDMLFNDSDSNAFLAYELVLSCNAQGQPRVLRETVRRAVLTVDHFEVTILLSLENGRGSVLDDGTPRHAGVTDTKVPALAIYGSLLAYPSLNLIYNQIVRWFFGRFEVQHRASTPAPARTGGHRHINIDGDNVSNVLDFYRKEHPDLYDTIIARISERLPEEKRIDQAFRNGGVTSGIRKLYTLLLLLEDPRPRPLICLEEPDGGLYHDMVDALSLAIRDYVIRNPDCQVFFTTHSQYILESMRPEEVWVFERRPEGPGSSVSGSYTHTRCVARDAVVRTMHAEGIGMGALWYSGHLESSWEDLHASGSTD